MRNSASRPIRTSGPGGVVARDMPSKVASPPGSPPHDKRARLCRTLHLRAGFRRYRKCRWLPRRWRRAGCNAAMSSRMRLPLIRGFSRSANWSRPPTRQQLYASVESALALAAACRKREAGRVRRRRKPTRPRSALPSSNSELGSGTLAGVALLIPALTRTVN